MRRRVQAVAFAPDVVLQVVGAEAVLLKLHEEDVFALNASGTRIAQLIAAGRQVDQVVDALCAEFSVARAAVERDVADLLDALLSRGLVVDTPQGGANG